MATSFAITKVSPQWGVNLKPGYCGFITREADFIGDGIAWFERFDQGLPFCHAFIIEGASDSPSVSPSISTCNIIEAHARTGVHRATLDEYLGQKECQCFVRVPIGYTEQLGAQIVAGMIAQLGDQYGYGLILADLLANTYLGHLINDFTCNIPDEIVCKLFTDAHHRICSQAVAVALKKARIQLGCLRRNSDTIMPADLGNDNSVFENFAYQLI